jgi:TRAP-type C4-dicarboxylate transport system permease small subunit
MDWILTFRRCSRRLCLVLATIGAVALMVMMFLIALDVIGRDAFDHAILGTFEVVEYLMIPTVFLALAYGQFEDIHINVDVAIQSLSPRKRAGLNVVTLLMTLLVFLPMTWVSYTQAMKVYGQKLASTVLLIPRWPFQVMALIGVAAFSLAIVMDLCVAIARAAGKEIDLQDAGKAKLAAD